MDKWLGIITGTNRGIVSFEWQQDAQNKIFGTFSVYDVENINISGKVEGIVSGEKISLKLFNIQPQGDGISKSGTADLVINGKEIKGAWATDLGAKGECILYQLLQSQQSAVADLSDPDLTLETKDITIAFCTFNKKSIEDIFKIMTTIVNAIRKDKKAQILPPIYSITYDAEERIRTYSLFEFLQKLSDAKKIWYVGFEFKDKIDLKNIFINISYQENIGSNIRSNVLVESTDKEIVMMIPEMVRGLVSKVKNRNLFFYHWLFEAVIQLAAVIGMFLLSYLVSNKLTISLPNYNIALDKPYIFVIVLIIFSNLWTYVSRMILGVIHRNFPVVDIRNRERVGCLREVIVTLLGAFILWAFTNFGSLIYKWLLIKG